MTEHSGQSQTDYATDPRVFADDTLTLSGHGPYELYVRETGNDKGWLVLTNTDTGDVLLDHEVDATLADDGMVDFEVWQPWFVEAEAAMKAEGYGPLQDA